MSKRVRVRFAPSPTGHLHIGGARTALFNWLFAKHEGGEFVLRIEDTDTTRSTKESEAALLSDLRWMGLDWDEGPDVGGPYGPYRQSERSDIYREQAERLLADGSAFHCYCTDEELEEKRKRALAEGRVPQYDGTCRDLSPEARAAFEADGRSPVVRLRGPERDVTVRDAVRGDVEFSRDMLGDFIILRSDGRPTYNFAVVVDDAHMEISHVIRAEDHLPNTMRQLMLYDALGERPPEFAHVSLIVDRDRSKLSKRRGASSMAELREQGFLPDAVVNYLALLGWSHPEAREIMTREELVAAFDLARVNPSPAAFDEDKLKWVNGHSIRELPLRRVAELARPFAAAAGLNEPDGARFEDMVDLTRDGVARLSDFPEQLSVFFDVPLEFEPEAAEWVESGAGLAVCAALLDRVSRGTGAIDAERFAADLKEVGKELGERGKTLFMPVRAALTGRTHGPSLGRLASIMGRQRVVDRLVATSKRSNPEVKR